MQTAPCLFDPCVADHENADPCAVENGDSRKVENDAFAVLFEQFVDFPLDVFGVAAEHDATRHFEDDDARGTVLALDGQNHGNPSGKRSSGILDSQLGAVKGEGPGGGGTGGEGTRGEGTRGGGTRGEGT